MNDETTKVQYDTAREALATGDIIVFSGRGAISSIIQMASRSRWSHVGMVIRPPGSDITLLAESTTLSDLQDIDTGEHRSGVQVVELSARIRAYDGDAIGFRHVDLPRGPRFERAIHRTRQRFVGSEYEKNRIQLAGAALEFLQNEADASTLFCSEYLAYYWHGVRWLRQECAPNMFSPAEVAGEDDQAFDRNVTFDPRLITPVVEFDLPNLKA